MTPFTVKDNGFPFSNADLPPVPIEVDLPFVGKVKLGEASGGLCGGMCAAALDYWHAGRNPPSELGDVTYRVDPKWTPDGLLGYLWQRQFDSLNIPWGIMRFMEHMAGPQRVGSDTDDARIAMGLLAFDETDKLEVQEEKPCVLGLVYRRSLDPAVLVECHQVVAYGIDGSTISVYDPDNPGETWSLIWDGKTWVEARTYPDKPVETYVPEDAYPVHSFFVVPYSRKEPPV